MGPDYNRTHDEMNWKLWFLQLSGWPVFLAVVVVVILFMITLSVVLTRLSSQSALRTAVLGVMVLVAIALGILGIVIILGH